MEMLIKIDADFSYGKKYHRKQKCNGCRLLHNDSVANTLYVNKCTRYTGAYVQFLYMYYIIQISTYGTYIHFKTRIGNLRPAASFRLPTRLHSVLDLWSLRCHEIPSV